MFRWTLVPYVISVSVMTLAFIMDGGPISFAALLAVIIVPLLFAAFAFVASKGKLSCRFSGAISTMKPATLECLVEIGNGQNFTISRARAKLRAHNLLTGDLADLELSMTVPGKSSSSVPVEIDSNWCGKIELELRDLCISDALSMSSWKSKGANAKRFFTVFPELHEISMPLALAASPEADSDWFSQTTKGPDRAETFSLREYVPGDPISQIHWKLTAKTEKVILREPSLPLARTTMVMWDKSIATQNDAPSSLDNTQDNSQPVSPERAEAQAAVVMAVCHALVSESVPFTLVSCDPKTRVVYTYDVTTEEEFYEGMSQVLGWSFARSEESAFDLYESIIGPISHARIYHVSSEKDLQLPGRFPGRRVISMFCDGSETFSDDTEIRQIGFDANGVDLALTRLVL